MVTQQWIDVINQSLANVWVQFLGFLPDLVGAIVTLIVGLIIAAGLEKLIERVIYHLKVDSALRKLGVETFLHRANMELDTGYFLGKVVYWFIVIAFVLAASDILGFVALSAFLSEVLLYIPQVFVAALIVLASVIVAGFLKRLVDASVKSARIRSSGFLGGLVWWVVIVFGLLAGTSQLGVASGIINTLITGVIGALALALGLAFGLGGKDSAKQVVDKVHKDWTK